MSDQCVFCKIINKEIQSDIRYEDDQVVVIRDINPQTPSHLLILPKVHISGMDTLTPEQSPIIAHIALVAKKLASQEGLSESGWRLVVNCGQDAKQTVFHLHVHILGGRPMTGQLA